MRRIQMPKPKAKRRRSREAEAEGDVSEIRTSLQKITISIAVSSGSYQSRCHLLHNMCNLYFPKIGCTRNETKQYNTKCHNRSSVITIEIEISKWRQPPNQSRRQMKARQNTGGHLPISKQTKQCFHKNVFESKTNRNNNNDMHRLRTNVSNELS